MGWGELETPVQQKAHEPPNSINNPWKAQTDVCRGLGGLYIAKNHEALSCNNIFNCSEGGSIYTEKKPEALNYHCILNCSDRSLWGTWEPLM